MRNTKISVKVKSGSIPDNCGDKIYKTLYVNLLALHTQSPNPGDKPTVPFKG